MHGANSATTLFNGDDELIYQLTLFRSVAKTFDASFYILVRLRLTNFAANSCAFRASSLMISIFLLGSVVPTAFVI